VGDDRLDRDTPDPGGGRVEPPPRLADDRLVGVGIEVCDDAVLPRGLPQAGIGGWIDATRPAGRVTDVGAEPRRSPQVAADDDEVASAA
jgi:hypothetical protein